MAGDKNKVMRKFLKKNMQHSKAPRRKSRKSLVNEDAESNTFKKPPILKKCMIKDENSVVLRDAPHLANTVKPYHCPYCDFQTGFSNLLRSHKRRHKIRMPWACSKCSFSTVSQFSLQRHVGLIHEKPPHLACTECDFKCSRMYQLKSHMLVHSSVNYFQCSKCNYKNVKKAAIKRHMIMHFDDIVQFKCYICQYTGVKPEYLTRHMKKHHEFELNFDSLTNSHSMSEDKLKIIEKQPIVLLRRCDDINESINSALDMGVIHEQILQDNFLEVAQCGGSEEINSELLKSEQEEDSSSVVLKSSLITKNKNVITSIVKVVDNNKHTELQLMSEQDVSTPQTQPKLVVVNEVVYNKVNGNSMTDIYRCKQCSFVSSWFDRFQKHLKLHSGECFSCDKCDFVTNSQTYLANHKRNKHSQQKDFQCKKCKYRCSSSQYLKAHMTCHVKVKRFKCDTCHTMCKTAANLKQHMKTHSKEKPFACNLCDFRTNYKSTLEHHMFVHTGESKYVCEVCNQKFYSNSYLKKHMEVHGLPK